MSSFTVVSAASQVLAHTPGLARHGSKPSRELPKDADVERAFIRALRDFDHAVAYPPHQAYLGALHPRDLPPRPWANCPSAGASRFAPDGEIMPEDEFLGLLAAVDEFALVTLHPDVADRAGAALAKHPLGAKLDLARLEKARANGGETGSLPLFVGANPAGAIKRAHDADEALTAGVLLENLCGKATATLALPPAPRQRHRSGVDRLRARLRRGSHRGSLPARRGNMAKAVAQSAGLSGPRARM
jgi:betaine reductase